MLAVSDGGTAWEEKRQSHLAKTAFRSSLKLTCPLPSRMSSSTHLHSENGNRVMAFQRTLN